MDIRAQAEQMLSDRHRILHPPLPSGVSGPSNQGKIVKLKSGRQAASALSWSALALGEAEMLNSELV